MAKQNVSTQFNEQRSEKAGRKRCIKLELIYRNNHPNRYLHWANCCNSKSVFLHNCLLHIIPKIFPGHLWTVRIRYRSWDFSVNASKTNDERSLSASERNVPTFARGRFPSQWPHSRQGAPSHSPSSAETTSAWSAHPRVPVANNLLFSSTFQATFVPLGH